MPSGSSMGSVGRRSVLAPLCATWRIAADGRSIGCREGVDIADASVIVQLYASALPIAVAGAHVQVMNLQHEFPLGALGVVADGAMAAVGGWERHRVAP